jgi:hypothetical protein
MENKLRQEKLRASVKVSGDNCHRRLPRTRPESGCLTAWGPPILPNILRRHASHVSCRVTSCQYDLSLPGSGRRSTSCNSPTWCRRVDPYLEQGGGRSQQPAAPFVRRDMAAISALHSSHLLESGIQPTCGNAVLTVLHSGTPPCSTAADMPRTLRRHSRGRRPPARHLVPNATHVWSAKHACGSFCFHR